MKVLSLFDGISCARVALERAGISVEAYYASEIDKYAMQISAKNWPDTKQLGGVKDIKTYSHTEGCLVTHHADPEYHKIDLLIGGSPCQDLSIAKKDRKGLDGDRSGLFWEYVRILKEVKPKYFILENVASMPKEAKALITETLGVEPIMIDAALVSAQRRKRLFWTNIPNVTQPEDRGILLKDILEDESDISFEVYNDKFIDGNKAKTLGTNPQCRTAVAGQLVLKTKSNTIRTGGRGSGAGDKHDWESVYQYRRTYWRETKGGKVPKLTANMGTGGNNVPYIKVKEATKKGFAIATPGMSVDIRKLTVIECERLQSLPDGYTDGVSNTQRYKALGNAFNVDVVAHILSFIPKSSMDINGSIEHYK